MKLKERLKTLKTIKKWQVGKGKKKGKNDKQKFNRIFSNKGNKKWNKNKQNKKVKITNGTLKLIMKWRET